MLNQFDGTTNADAESAEVRLRSIYDMLLSDASSVRDVIQNVLDRTEGRYLVIRDPEGQVLIRVSFIGGLIILALALFVTRLRWVPFIPLILLVVYLRLSFQVDREDDPEFAEAARDAGHRVRRTARSVSRDVRNAARNVGSEVSDAAQNVRDDVNDATQA